ncbi:hypothetical protein NPIL_120531, partial [Nephila pilipes]
QRASTLPLANRHKVSSAPNDTEKSGLGATSRDGCESLQKSYLLKVSLRDES